MQDFKRLLKYLRPHWLTFVIATIAMVLAAFFETATGALLVPILNQAFGFGDGKKAATLFNLQNYIPDSGVEAWRTIAILLIAFTILKGIAEYFSSYLMAKIGQSAVLNLRQDLYEHLLQQATPFFERHRTNFLVSRLVTSAASIELAISSNLRDTLRESFMLIGFLSAAFFYNWRLTLGSLIIAPIIAFLTAKFSKSLRKLAGESIEGNQILTDTAQETLSNQTIVKAYQAEEVEMNRFRKVAQKIANANLRSGKIAALSPPTIELFGVFAIVTLLFFGQNEISSGNMKTEQFITFLFFLLRSYDPMRKIARQHNQIQQAIAAARNINEILDENETMPEKAGAKHLEPLRDCIELRNVSFNYQTDDKPILSYVNLKIPFGSMVALVGESGGGKSTLTKLIPRFYDVTGGEILWDKTDLRDAKLTSLRKHLALVTQETTLFNDTIRNNITYGKPSANDEEVINAAKIAFAHDFVAELPNGYETIVGERGIFLSGGQRQRIAIARAVLTDALVLILDEATSALDSESERLVQKALENLMQNRTSIVIAHRLSTVRKADKIVVMERGKIVETGTHAELLEQNGVYKKLYELQFAEEENATEIA